MNSKHLFLPLFLVILFISCENKNKQPVSSSAVTSNAAAQPKAAVEPPDEKEFNSIDTVEIFKRLFDNPLMQHKTAIWKPNFYERMTFPLSYDDSCHTVVDTILYFTDRENRECAAILLVTYRFWKDSTDGLKIKSGDCHFCGAAVGIALLSQSADQKWAVYKFEKAFTSAGNFGGTGEGGIGMVSLVRIGNRWTCLSLKQPIGGNGGYLGGQADLYSIEEYNLNGFPNKPLSNIFSYTYYSTNADSGEKVTKEEKSDITLVKRARQYYGIDLVTVTNGKKKKTKRYDYSDEYNCYMVK